MPNHWINREIESSLTGPAAQLRIFPVWLVLGRGRLEKALFLEDAAVQTELMCARANRDPGLFLKDLKLPLVC